MVSSTSKIEMGEPGDVISRFTSKKSRRLEMSCNNQCIVRCKLKGLVEYRTTDMLVVAQSLSKIGTDCKWMQQVRTTFDTHTARYI